MDYSFLTRQTQGSKLGASVKDYSFLTRPATIPSVPTETEGTDFRKVRIPLHLGGGEYMTNGKGDLYLTPRSQDSLGGTLPGKERDHIIPVSLGGTSNIQNLQYLDSKPSFWQRIGGIFGKKPTVQQSPNRQEGKLKVEQEAIKGYKSGKLSVGEARLMVLMENMRIQGIIPDKQTTWQNMGYGTKKALEEVFVKAPVGLVKQMGGNILGSFDFLHRTGLHTITGIGTVVSPSVVSIAKFLGDDQLKNLSYDEIWKEELRQGEKRMLDIGRPDEYFRAKITGDNYVPMMLFSDEVKELAKSSNDKMANGDVSGSFSDMGKIAGIKFMTDWANPFYLFAIRGIKYDPTKPRGKVLLQGKIKSNNTLLGKAKPQQAVLEFQTKPQNIVEVAGSKVKGIKEPKVRMWLNVGKDGTIKYDVRNLGGDILNRNLFKAVSDIPTQPGNNIVMSLPASVKVSGVTPAPFKELPQITKGLTTIKGLSPELQPLAREALKYESVDEFIKAQENYYHATRKNIKELDLSKDGVLYLSKDKTFGSRYLGKDANVLNVSVAPKKTKVLNDKDVEKIMKDSYFYDNRGNKTIKDIVDDFNMSDIDKRDYVFNQLKNDGYDSVIIKNDWDGSMGYMESFVALDKSIIKTKSELKDIWKKAHKLKSSSQSTPTPTKPSIEPSFSRHYERIKEQYGFKGSVELDRKTELVEKKKSFNYIQRNPEKALRIGYEYDEVPKEINQQVFRASLVASLNAQGKTALAQEVAKIQSLKMTEAAQTLAFGRVDIGTEASIIKNITQARLEKIGKGLGVKKPEKRVEQARQVIERQAKDASKKVSELQKGKNTAKQLKEIDDLISSIIC